MAMERDSQMALKAPLGRGLGALIPNALQQDIGTGKTQMLMCGVEELAPGRYQARKHFAPVELQELATSIKTSGVIQPILVRKAVNGKGYEIIAGERRWRAAQKAGLKEVPVIIKQASDAEVAEMSLVENLQRENLNSIEEATAYQQLIEDFKNTHEEIAQRIGKDRSTITNALRLLKLPLFVQTALIHGEITSGHARSLLALGVAKEIEATCKAVISKKLSVRATELLVQKQLAGTRETKIATPTRAVQDVERSLSSALKTKATIAYSAINKGKVTIAFGSAQELDRIVNIIRKGCVTK